MRNLTIIIFLSISLSYHGKSYAMIKQAIHQKDSIYSLEKINLGGTSQTILITGRDPDKPILLFLHGGPGFSEMAMVRKYSSDLDKHFIVVNWDQRGTNLSYSPLVAKSSMTIEQVLEDAKELVDILKKRFNRKKIFLLGHSWGSAIGIMLADRYPGDFYAYIGVGQVANMEDNEKVSFAYALKKAKQNQDKKALAELKAILPYPSSTSTLQQLYTSRKWMDYYSGGVYRKHGPDELFKGITNGKNPLYDMEKADAGIQLSMETLWPPLMKTNLPQSVKVLKIPVYFILGKHDFNVPYTLAIAYLHKLKAPSKKLILFKKSAHYIPFEEPVKFVKEMALIASTVK